MNELEQILAGDGAAAPPEFILEGLADGLAHRRIEGAPRSIYEELWHIAFWQQLSIDWTHGIETPYPGHASGGFPTESEAAREDWEALKARFFDGNRKAAATARDTERLELPVRCPSRPGVPTRTMTVREQLENLGAHNAYHFGRIVLLRQLRGSWPPPSGGYSW
jgi:hypothetical protein